MGPRQTLRIRRRDRDRAGRARRDLPESMDAVDRVKVRSGKGLLTIGRRLFPGPCLLKLPWTPCRFPVGIGRLSGSVGNRASGSVAGCPMTRRFEAGSPPVFRRSFAGLSMCDSRQIGVPAIRSGGRIEWLCTQRRSYASMCQAYSLPKFLRPAVAVGNRRPRTRLGSYPEFSSPESFTSGSRNLENPEPVRVSI